MTLLSISKFQTAGPHKRTEKKEDFKDTNVKVVNNTIYRLKTKFHLENTVHHMIAVCDSFYND